MSSARRRRRRSRGSTAVTEPTVAQQPAPREPEPESHIVPMPEWRWRTLPVFFALALGLLVGTWGGVAAGYAASEGNELPMNLMFIFSAVLMGLALSRFMTRFIISRQWVKPKERFKGSRRRRR